MISITRKKWLHFKGNKIKKLYATDLIIIKNSFEKKMYRQTYLRDPKAQ